MSLGEVSTDRRVRRSRSALFRAAVDLVGERGTTNVAVSELAEAADVSRQLIYQQFGDRDTLLLEAALDLARRELTESDHEVGVSPGMTAALRHFAGRRAFYRAMLTGPCAYRLTIALSNLLSPFNRELVRGMPGVRAGVVDDLTTFVTGGWAAVMNDWIINGPVPLDVEAFAARLMKLLRAINPEVR
jgi:AcrR family transcriptional regulator